jgi:hypothetical protein
LSTPPAAPWPPDRRWTRSSITFARTTPGRLEAGSAGPVAAPPGRPRHRVRSLQEAIDTTTPGGKLVFHIFAALAEFERDLIRERTTAARARGRTGGRPAVMTEPKIKLAREMYASRQYTVAAIASTLGVSRASIYRHLDDLES